MQADGAFFIDHGPDGRPYLGFALQLPGLSMSFVLADQAHAAMIRDGMIDAVNELMKTKPKLQAVEGVISDGRIRPAEGRQQLRPRGPRS